MARSPKALWRCTREGALHNTVCGCTVTFYDLNCSSLGRACAVSLCPVESYLGIDSLATHSPSVTWWACSFGYRLNWLAWSYPSRRIACEERCGPERRYGWGEEATRWLPGEAIRSWLTSCQFRARCSPEDLPRWLRAALYLREFAGLDSLTTLHHP
jgi:hypothetical protein